MSKQNSSYELSKFGIKSAILMILIKQQFKRFIITWKIELTCRCCFPEHLEILFAIFRAIFKLLWISQNVKYGNMRSTCKKMTLLDRYCSPDHFGTSFTIFRLTMRKRRIKRLFNLIHFNQFKMTSKEKLLSCCELNIAR